MSNEAPKMTADRVSVWYGATKALDAVKLSAAPAGFPDVRVTPRQVYVDGSRPDLAEGFVRRTFTAMVAGVRTPALAAGLSTTEAFDTGITDLMRTAERDGVFSYTFYKAVGVAA